MSIKVTSHMKYHAKQLLKEVQRQGGDYVSLSWVSRLSDGDGLLNIRVSEPGGEYAYWKDGEDEGGAE